MLISYLCLTKYIDGDIFSVFTLCEIVVYHLPFVKEQTQPTLADRYKKHFIIINKIMRHSNDTGHSLTVCTKTHMAFRFETFLFLHIWVFKLNCREAEFIKYLQGI